MAGPAHANPNPKGRNTSFWMSRNASNVDSYPALRSEATHAKFDVIVIGAGITGLTAALHLKRSGRRVAVLEHHKVGSGTSGSSTGHISLYLDSNYKTIVKNFGKEKAAMVFRGQMEARDEIATNCRELSIPGYEGNVDVFLYAEPGTEAAEVHDEYEALSHAGASHVELLPAKTDIGLPFPAESALRLPGSAQFDAYRYCIGLARAVHGDGSAVFENTRVVEIKDGVPCEVKTEFLTLHAPEVICATHTPLGISVVQTAMVPCVSFVLAVHVEQPLPAGLYYDTHDPYHYIRRLDAANPRILIIGGCDKKTGGTNVSDKECFAELRRYAAQHFRVEEELAHWSAQIFPSPDGLPYVGTNPGEEHVWIATGFAGDGLTHGAMAGKLLALELLGQTHPLAAVYSSHRFKPLATAKHFLSEQLSVAKHLVVDRLTAARASLDEVAPGEGRVMKVHGKHIAAYREHDGRLHAHSAVCTHLKCIVKWNDAERTFDCPCHGSRFSVCGTVLEGPALRDLEDLIYTSARGPSPPPAPAVHATDQHGARI